MAVGLRAKTERGVRRSEGGLRTEGIGRARTNGRRGALCAVCRGRPAGGRGGRGAPQSRSSLPSFESLPWHAEHFSSVGPEYGMPPRAKPAFAAAARERARPRPSSAGSSSMPKGGWCKE
eukprot:1579105-Prymnesium_polylepis.1